MAFPTSPANNQTALVNGIVYQWNATLGVWKRNGSVNSISVGQAILTAAQESTSNTTGTLIVSGGAGITGNVYADGIYITDPSGITFADGSTQTTAASGIDQTARNTANSATTLAQASYDTANTKLSTSGGTVTGTLTVDGEAGITGNLSVTKILTVGTLQIPNAITSNVSLFTGINSTQNTNITAADTKAENAFTRANSANVLAQAAFDYANTILSLDNNIDQTARNTANTASSNTIYTQGVDNTQNTRITIIEGVNTWQNNRIDAIDSFAQGAYNAANTVANTSATIEFTQSAFNKANSANVVAQAAFDYANTILSSGNSIDQFARNTANTALSNTIYTQGVDATQNTNITSIDVKAQSAYDHANTKFASNGGIITGSVTISANNNLTVTGNLNVLGTTTTVDTNLLEVNDPMILLAKGNFFTDILDIGFAGSYNNGANAHTGLFRDSTNKEWYFFEGYTPEVSGNNNIDIEDVTFRKSNVNASNFKGNVITSGYNVFDFAQAAFNSANTKLATSGGTITGTLTIDGEVGITGNLTVSGTSVLTTLNATTANISFLNAVNNSQNTRIDAAFNQANSANVLAQAAFDKANTGSSGGAGIDQYARDTANTGGASAAIAAALANAAFIQANTVTISTQAAFDQANTATNNTIYINGISLSQNSRIDAAFDQANAANVLAQAAFNQANTGGGGGSGIDQYARDTANAATGNITSYSETTVSPIISGGTLTLDLSQGTTFNVTIDASVTTLNITNPAITGRTSSAMVVFNYNGTAYSVTWPASVRWPGGVAPGLTNTNGKKDIFTFFTMDGGSSYVAIISALNV